MKIPSDYAWEALRNHPRGYGRVEPIHRDALVQSAVSGLIRVTTLRAFFKNNAAYQDWRQRILVPRRYWEQIVNQYPDQRAYAKRQMRVNRSASPPPAARQPTRSKSLSPVRRKRGSRSPSPIRRNRSPQRKTPRYRKGDLKMQTTLGRFTSAQRRQVPISTLSIARTGDECDENDVNLPKPLCKAIRKACRRYNANRQYVPYQTDGSETYDYDINVSYDAIP